ncbi:MAG: hypothetical protein EBR67_00400 [Proteobacteria bacterium]|nr:hypothetical protein [Pseudomonadota bacterium]
MLFRFYLFIVMTFSMAACSSFSSQEMTKYDTRHLAKGAISYKVFNTWIKEPVSNSMRLEQYKIADNSNLSVSFLPGNAGGLEANIERWKNQFSQDAAFQILENTQFNYHSIPVTKLYLNGNYLESKDPFNPSAQKLLRENWAAYIIVAETELGTWFFKVLGPAQELKREENNLDDFIRSFAIKEPQ